MRSLSTVLVSSLLTITGCASTQPDAFEIERDVTAKVDGATCSQLATNMSEALDAMEAAKDLAKKGDLATIGGLTAGTLLIPIPFLGPILTGIGMAGQTKGVQDGIEPELLYRASFDAYKKHHCAPKIRFGDRVSTAVASSETSRNVTQVDPEVLAVQRELNKRGYDAGPADGIYGSRTRSALVVFQNDHKLEASGEVSPETLAALGL